MDIKKLKKAIQNIVDYSWDDERNDYADRLEEKESVKTHIFVDLVALDNFVTGDNHETKDHMRKRG